MPAPTRRPCGDGVCMHLIESQTGRTLTPCKPVPRPKNRLTRQGQSVCLRNSLRTALPMHLRGCLEKAA